MQRIIDLVNEVQSTNIAVGEVFKIEGTDDRCFRFTEEAFEACTDVSFKAPYNADWRVTGILLGTSKIVELNKPRIGEYYFAISLKDFGGYVHIRYKGDCHDAQLFGRGLAFMSEQECAEKVKKLMEVLR